MAVVVGSAWAAGVRRRRGRVVVPAVVVALLLGSVGAGQAAAAHSGQPSFNAVVQAAGVGQQVRCAGPPVQTAPPGPTVVLVNGLGVGSSYWSRVRGMIRDRARVCTVDRPGLGDSPRRAEPTVVTAGKQAGELWAALHGAGEAGPFVVVGHSYGGLIARAFAQRFARQVVAMLLLDASYPSQWRYGSRYWWEPRAKIDMARTEAQLRGHRSHMRHVPLIVMTAGIGSSSRWLAHQRVMAAMSDDSEHLIVPGSSHVIQGHRPAAVLRGISELLRAVRHRSPLPRCRSVAAAWRSVGAVCDARSH